MVTKITVPKKPEQTNIKAIEQYREHVKQNPSPNSLAAVREELEKLRKIVLGE